MGVEQSELVNSFVISRVWRDFFISAFDCTGFKPRGDQQFALKHWPLIPRMGDRTVQFVDLDTCAPTFLLFLNVLFLFYRILHVYTCLYVYTCIVVFQSFRIMWIITDGWIPVGCHGSFHSHQSCVLFCEPFCSLRSTLASFDAEHRFSLLQSVLPVIGRDACDYLSFLA